MASYLQRHRPILAVLSLLAVVAVPVLLAVAGGSEPAARPAPQTVLASATSPVTEASVTVATTPRNVADTTVPTTVAPTTVPVTVPPPPPAPPVTEPPPPPAPEPAPAQGTGNTMTVSSTAYCGGGTTASGESVREGGAAMNAAPLGTTWRVVGTGATYTVTDRIGSGSDFDIYFSSCGAANQYGRQTITIEQVG